MVAPADPQKEMVCQVIPVVQAPVFANRGAESGFVLTGEIDEL
jgi:hypothetical protein